MKNHRIVITRHGGPEVLALIEEELAEPAPGEVQLRVLASGVAYGDVIKREAVVSQPSLPFTPGYDLIGTVAKGGSRFSAGQRVTGWIKNGGHAEYANIRENLLVPVPEEVDTIEALSLVLNYVTAHQMLYRIAKARSGETILVHGAAGGVGTALLELARLEGIFALGTASLGKHALVRELGGEPIDYKSEDFVTRVRALTAGEGVSAVFDPIGGAHLARSFSALRKQGGRLVCYGVSEALSNPGARRKAVIGTVGRLLIYKAFGFGRRAYFYGIGRSPYSSQPQIQEDLLLLLGLLRDKRIKPIIGARFPLAQARQAHELMERAGTTGKIVLEHFTS